MIDILLVPDLDRLRLKLERPPPLLAELYARFRKRLAEDDAFRQDHIFLPALLGDPEAIPEARERILTLALDPLLLARDQSPGCRTTAQESLDGHIWCVAPRAMRLAVYSTWLEAHGAWTPEARRAVGTAILGFFYEHVVPVLRARTPGGHNQQFSMTFCSAVAGHAFADVAGLADRARALRDWALPKFRQVLGLMPASGYSGEGSTYQSVVVSPLVLWAGIFLTQLGEQEVWMRRRGPNGARLADTLAMEAAMGSCGGLLPPWDNYGWAPIRNLAARTLWAGLTRDPQWLQVAAQAWDRESFIAWLPDDRLWTLICWPEEESLAGDPARADDAGPLSGWSLPPVGAAIEYRPRRLRVMAAWDACSGSLQGIGRAQVNPNHLMIDMAGEPITADGWDDGSVRYLSETSFARSFAAISLLERDLIARQYGSFEAWFARNQQGFLGTACAILVDGWESYLPRHERRGSLLFEHREAARHTFTGEAAAFYQPAFDVTRMRRTVSVGRSGVIWIVDDARAATVHEFAWRLWLRRGLQQTGPQSARLDLPSGPCVTLAWFAEVDGVPQPGRSAVAAVTAFPLRGPTCWPDEGSDRLDLRVSGRSARFAVCLVPEGVEGLSLRQVGPDAWQASWIGGGERFEPPPAIAALPDPEPVLGEQFSEAHTRCDLDEAPFALLDEPDASLLDALDAPPVEAWRRTGAAMQTLTTRGCREAMPKIVALLEDRRQSYTVHSVAAWCLGRARHAPALPVLKRMASIPEENTAARARWAVERIRGESCAC